jgi:hypothetical protein
MGYYRPKEKPAILNAKRLLKHGFGLIRRGQLRQRAKKR